MKRLCALVISSCEREGMNFTASVNNGMDKIALRVHSDSSWPAGRHVLMAPTTDTAICFCCCPQRVGMLRFLSKLFLTKKQYSVLQNRKNRYLSNVSWRTQIPIWICTTSNPRAIFSNKGSIFLCVLSELVSFFYHFVQ